MAQNDPVITFETLYDIMRREKARDELQKLDLNFYNDVASYIKDKQNILESQAGKDSIFASQELDKTRTQLKNVLKIVKDLYDRRESKVIQLALLSARNKDKIYDTSALLPEEHSFYGNVKSVVESSRDGFFSLPSQNLEKPKDLKTKAKMDNGYKVRMLDDVPEFLGTDLQSYGPFTNGTISSLPSDIAEMLVSTNQAVKENESTEKNE